MISTLFKQAATAAVIGVGLFTVASAAENDEWDMLDEYCTHCHNDKDFKGGASFEWLNASEMQTDAKLWETITRKLRARLMPPRDEKHPDQARVNTFLTSVEDKLDALEQAAPNPGAPLLHRLNRSEYTNAIRDVLGLEINAATLLPPDDSAGGFDNAAQALTVSPALLQGYLSASAKVAAMAVGDPSMTPAPVTYRTAPDQSQDEHIEGAPLGTRGGLVFEHFFPLDAEYVFEPKLYRGLQAQVKGLEFRHALEVTIDKQRVSLVEMGGYEDNAKSHANAFGTAEALDARLRFRLPIKAGPHRVTVAFLAKPLAESADVWQSAQRTVINANEDKGVPHVDKINITGPFAVTGAGDTPSRRRILTCRPAASRDEVACATKIISPLARLAYRRPISEKERADLLSFYRKGRESGTFESGIQAAIRRIISGPEFLFRAELEPAGIAPNTPYRISDIELASRLSFFLWSTIPDEELLTAAIAGKLRDPEMLRKQVQRMLKDAKAESLVTNFASQWLTLRNLRATVPDPETFPDFDNNLREAFIRETQLFFQSIIAEDRSVVDLLQADYSFVNERLARHYGIPGVYGSRFRRVKVDESRRGLLGQGSILTLTSVATRTSAVGRGKWVLANLLANEPPAPPPNVPTLEQSATLKPQTLREQLAAHRAEEPCASCHKLMDPIGFSLENFDAVGRWREKDRGLQIDASDVTYDGTQIHGVAELRKFLINNEYMFVRAMTEKLMTYGLGRAVDYHDMTAVRKIVRAAAGSDNRFSALILGIASSVPFQMKVSSGPEEATKSVTTAANTGSSRAGVE